MRIISLNDLTKWRKLAVVVNKIIKFSGLQSTASRRNVKRRFMFYEMPSSPLRGKKMQENAELPGITSWPHTNNPVSARLVREAWSAVCEVD
jgi:hypothetical protein